MSNQKKDRWVQCEVEVLVETEKAFRFRVAGEAVWIPKSQMRYVDEVELAYHDDSEALQTVVMKEWIAGKTGIDGSCEPFDEGVPGTEDAYSDYTEDRSYE